MEKLLKFTTIVFTIVSLTACLEVEDNDGELVQALQQQNEILAAQNAAQQADNSVTLTGKIKNISTDSMAQNGSIKIKIGNDWSELSPIANDGSFELTLLPTYSDYALVVSSENDSFLERIYFGTTRGSSTGISYQDIGFLDVSKGEVVSFSVLDSGTSVSIQGLELYASSRVIQSYRIGEVDDYEAYLHTSTYNEETHQYDITLPADIFLDIYSSLDLDGDGSDDYRVEGSNYATSRLIQASNVKTQSVVYLVDVTPVEQVIEFRVAVLDEESNVLKNLSLTIDDDINNKIFSEFDEDSQQHVLSANLSSSLNILIPAFTTETKSYNSASISISTYSDYLRVKTSTINQYGNASSNYYNLPLDIRVADIVIQLSDTSGNSSSSEIEVILKSTDLSENNTSYNVFYSQPINILENSIELIQKDVLSIVRGNESVDDLILSGTTSVSSDDINLRVNATLSLNGTKLTVEAETPLQEGYQYQYMVNDVVDVNTDEYVDISNDDSAQFKVEITSSDIFDINSLKLDNNNYYHNAEIIKATNTAGQMSTYSYRSQDAYLVIPTTALAQLKNLTIQRMIVTRQGNEVNSIRSWQVIQNGQWNSVSSKYTLSTAYNEVMTYNGYYSNFFSRGLNIPDGKVYLLNTSEYLYDDTDASENSITFEYSYETIEGDISTGTITLPVQ